MRILATLPRVRPFIIVLTLLGSAAFAAHPIPLLQAHAHNDYEHARPLFDALDRGFCNIEADIYLVDGQLLVAHHLKDTKPERTLAKLYLDPLAERVQRNGGRVYREGPALMLLVDIKTEAGATYAALHAELERYTGLLTVFRGTEREQKAVTVIISGNRPIADLAAQPVRYAAIDGRADDLTANRPAILVPLISENWSKIFTWGWTGEMPAAEKQKLHRWVEQAHVQGRQVRFWGTPDRPDAWRILREAGVDLIGTDHLAELQSFLTTPKE